MTWYSGASSMRETNDTQDVDGVAVGHPVARLVHERKGCQRCQPNVGTLAERQSLIGPRNWPRHRETVSQAAGVSEQVLDQNGSSRGMCAIQRAGGIVQHGHLAELRCPTRDRVTQCQFALVDQAHRRRHRDRLGHRRDAKQRVALHGHARVDIAIADLVDLQQFFALPDHGYRAGKQARVAYLADGRLIAVEIHPVQDTVRASAARRITDCANVFPRTGRVLLSRSPANVIWGTCCERGGMLVTMVSLLVNQGVGRQSPRPATMDGAGFEAPCMPYD